MIKNAILEAAQQLPAEERVELLDELWDSVLEHSPPELTPEEKRIIDERLKSMEENPDSGIPWEEAKKLIRKMPMRRLSGMNSRIREWAKHFWGNLSFASIPSPPTPNELDEFAGRFAKSK